MEFKKYVFGWCFLDLLCWGYGEIFQMAITLDKKCQKMTKDDFEIVDNITIKMLRQNNITATHSCSLGCTNVSSDAGCPGQETYNVLLKADSCIDRKLILNVTDIGVADPHGFICARRTTAISGSCPTPAPSASSASDKSLAIGLGVGLSVLAGSCPTPAPSASSASDKSLAIGLGVGLSVLAALTVGAGLLYRRFLKKNAVNDESDTTGIVGTPVTPIGEATNSAPPAGTA